MAMGGIARVSQIQLLQPFVIFALASYFNGETVTLQILLFASAVVGYGGDLDAHPQASRAHATETGP